METMFEDECRELCDDITGYAESSRPTWTGHPDQRKWISAKRFELFKDFPLSGKKVLKYQYVFTPTTILIALYITMSGDEADAICGKLEAAKADIAEQCGSRTSWDYGDRGKRKGKPIRLRILGHSTPMELVKYDADEHLIRHLVELMRRFQEATVPIVGVADSP